MSSFGRGYGYRFDIGEYFPRAVKTLCIACVSVFLLQEFSRLIFRSSGWNFWLRWFGLSPYAAVHGLRVWDCWMGILTAAPRTTSAAAVVASALHCEPLL